MPQDAPTRRLPTRRDALRLGAAAALAPAQFLAAQDRNLAAPQVLRRWPLSVQLWSVFAQLKADLPGTLAAIKSAGFDVVESAGLLGRSATAFRRLLDEAGLTCLSAHAPMADLVAQPAKAVEDAQALGARWLVCASPQPPVALPTNQNWLVAMREAMTLDAWKANAASLAELAPVAARAGLRLAYHNHFMEFIDHGGVTGYDTLLAAVPPASLRLELDVGWVRVAGLDPLRTLHRYAGRVDLLHVKDMIADAASPVGYRSVEVGRGVIDWPPLLAAARDLNVQALFVEQEAPYVRDIFESLAITREYLRALP